MTGPIVFIDFEASSLAKQSYPIEVAWVFESGTAESRLIRPAPLWTDWSAKAAAIHGIGREQLVTEGLPYDEVARRMIEQLDGARLYASAPSWDGQWLSKLLRASGLPRHALRLQDTDEAHRAIVLKTLRRAGLPPERHGPILGDVLSVAEKARKAAPTAHRALADAQAELEQWRMLALLAEMAADDMDR